jgi:hypothetical protein
MATSILLPPPVSPASHAGRFVRVEYLDFQNVGKDREFRFRVYGADGSTEFRLRIAIAAFAAGRVRLQDGPDVCYQKLLRAVAAGDTASPGVIAIDDVDLAIYLEAHTKVPKRRSWTPSSPAPSSPTSSSPTLPNVPPRQSRTPSPRLPVAPLVTSHGEPALEEGQRVSHSVFGAGVTTSSSRGHTVVCFDQAGPKTFVTSMLKVDVLSAPHMWETSPRGKNRPCRTAGVPAVAARSGGRPL